MLNNFFEYFHVNILIFSCAYIVFYTTSTAEHFSGTYGAQIRTSIKSQDAALLIFHQIQIAQKISWFPHSFQEFTTIQVKPSFSLVNETLVCLSIGFG